MSQKQITELLDDVDGSPAAETLTFTLDGVNYQIDLNRKHAKQFRTALRPYTAAARTTKRGAGGQPSAPPPTPVSTDAVRAWARAHRIPVAPRGRIAASVIEQFRAAGN